MRGPVFFVFFQVIMIAPTGVHEPAQAKSACNQLSVAIDIGHSASAPGAISARGKQEYLFNQRFSNELAAMSSDWPRLRIKVLKSPRALSARSSTAEKIGADLFVSIHHDSVNKKFIKTWRYDDQELQYSDDFTGHSIFVSRKGEQFDKSLALAKQLGERLRAAGRAPTLHHAENLSNERRELLDEYLGIYEAPFVVLATNKLPAILFEVGVIVNRAEELLLEDANYRADMQKALLSALDAMCQLDLDAAPKATAP